MDTNQRRVQEGDMKASKLKTALRDKVIGQQPSPAARKWFDDHVIVLNVTAKELKNGKR